MPRQVLGEFKVERLEILDTNGDVDSALEPKLSVEQLEKLYYHLILARMFDQTAISLQREGRLLTYGSLKGQEAAQVPVAFAMEKQDWLAPSFREHGAMLTLGAPAKNLYMYWGGDERGQALPEGVNILPVSVPVGSQILHAVGVAMAHKKKKVPACTVAFFGDGATSNGAFHEGLNFAGVFNTPNVFVCQNNQWAISVPRARQTASQTLAQKAIAYGINGIQVDGNDALAMYVASKEALDKARAGNGPTLIEAFTYRMEHHTTADDWTRYRDATEVEEWAKRDPIDRMRKYLVKKIGWTEQKDRALMENTAAEIAKAVQAYESVTPPIPLDMFQNTYADMTDNLKGQWEYLWQHIQAQVKENERKA